MTVDMETVEQFFDTLHAGGQVAHWWNSDVKVSIWFDTNKRKWYPSSWENDGNIYFCIHPCTQIPNNGHEEKEERFRKSRLEYVAAINCVFAEFDVKDYGDKDAILAHLWTLPIYPSVVIDSGGGYHCYWLFSSTVIVTKGNRGYIKRLQYAWVDKVGGDDASKDLARVLRVPGTKNRKEKYAPNYPVVSFVECDLEQVYSLAEIESILGDALNEPSPKKSRGTITANTTDDLITAATCLRRLSAARADDYGDWLRVGMTLHSLGDAGLQLWDEWSQRSDKYRDGVCDAKWASFTDGGVTLGTLVHMANEDDPAGKVQHGKTFGAMNGEHQTSGASLQEVTADKNIDPSTATLTDDAPAATGAQLPLVVELLRLTIDAGQNIDTLRDVVKKLSDQDKRDPLIVQQLRRVIVGQKRQSQEKAIELWIRSCGSDRDSETETIITQLNRHGYDFRMNELDDSIETGGKILNDGLQAEIRCLMRDAKFKCMAAVTDAYTMNAYHNRYHPIKDFLNDLAWDGADHIAALAEHFTCSDTPIAYTDGTTGSVIHAFLKRWLVGAVGKVYEQAQNVTLTMAGPQGIGKSYVAKWLCSPMRNFFNEGQLDPDGKETDRRLATTWVWEIGELGATTRRSDVNALKNKLTQESVKFRVPYGHSDVIKPVLTSFIGTVNPDGRGFLIDKTGNRRFAVVNITAIDHAYSTKIDAAQIWAQAASLYRAGEPWRLTPEERATQEVINAEHTTEDALTMIMGTLFHIDPTNDSWRMSPFDVAHTLLMNNYAKDVDKCAKDASAWLRAHGHEKRGKPLSWRGISAKLSGEIEQDRLDVKNSITRDAATALGL